MIFFPNSHLESLRPDLFELFATPDFDYDGNEMDIFVVARSSPLLTLIDDTRMCWGGGYSQSFYCRNAGTNAKSTAV